MGQLPPERVSEADAFNYSGVDFASPFDCKCTEHRSTKTSKVYLAIFVCLSSRAVHLEIVSRLTTASFLDALKRFIARYGVPKVIMSDNGRTFTGAKNHLSLTELLITSFAVEENISWQFIPPRTPYLGDIWEAAVKAAKYNLVFVVWGQVLSFKEYNTVFCQIEGILNLRPLAYRREADKSIVMITPAHLAIGRPVLHNIRNLYKHCSSMGVCYNLVRDIVNSFWLSC